MKKIYLIAILFLLFSKGFSQIWVNTLTSGRPIGTYYLGDRITNPWFFQFEIGQTSWNISEVGIGQSTDGSTGWSWSSATWYQDGTGSNKRVQRNIGNFQFTAPGSWFIVGRAKANAGDSFTYSDEGGWTNNTALLASSSSGNCPYFTVLDLSNPTALVTTSISDSQITINWTKWNSKNVMIVRRISIDTNNNVPVAGTTYTVGVGAPQLGTGTVVYNSNGTSFTDTNLLPGQSYTYTLYSENNNYYSSGVSCTGYTKVTWNGTSWSNTTGPSISIDAIIDGIYTTTQNGVFSANTLTINNGKSLTINSGNNITIAGAITNSGNVTVENNANLIQTNPSATNTGNISVNKNSATIQLYDYTLWSSPVVGQKLKAFSPNTLDNRFYSYDPITNLYTQISDPLNTDFAQATGYLLRAPNTWTPGTLTNFNGIFTGVPNNGTINLTGLTGDKFYAVGNPYPSSISATSFLNGNTTGGTLYFWRKTNGASGTAYATQTIAGATSSGGLTPTDNIGIGQGFIVKTGPSTTTLSFNNNMRTASNSLVFLKTNEIRNRYWINLNSPTELICQTLVCYMPEATTGIDNTIDGKYINDSPISLTSLINDEEYSIQGRSLPFNISDIVPLSFKTNIAGNYTISIDHVDGFFSNGQSIYLKDKYLNLITDLGIGSYTFSSISGTFNSRFEIVYQNALGNNNLGFTSNSVIVFTENGEININTGNNIIENVNVYDIQGRLLVEKKQINGTETKIHTTAVNQVLLVEITAINGLKVTKKIIQ